MNTFETLVANIRELETAEAAAIACTLAEARRIHAELDAWAAAPLPLSIDTTPPARA